MSDVPLLKPGSYTGAILSGLISTAGTSFYIKVARSRIIVRHDVENSTGDGDTFNNYTGNYMLDLAISLSGFMPVSGNNLLTSLVSTTLNPMATTMVFNLGTSKILRIPRGIIVQSVIDWRRAGANVPLALFIRASDEGSGTIPTLAAS